MHNDRQIRARSAPKTEPDVRKLSRALLALAMAQAKAEKEAQEQAVATSAKDTPPTEAPGRKA